jgi:hypothetical protein
MVLEGYRVKEADARSDGCNDVFRLEACSSLVEHCLNMADEGVRFLPRLPLVLSESVPAPLVEWLNENF